jgi:hypothetical protein
MFLNYFYSRQNYNLPIPKKSCCETRGKYASKESHAFEAYCDVHLALKASPCGLAISENNKLSL